MSDKVISSTTQEFLDVYDIVNDMVLLKDGSAAIILLVGTMNFSLLAEQEQDAVIFTYGSVLNSLNYPIQINIQSQTKDATKYLRLLDEQVTKASSDRKANLIKQYRAFVEGLIKERNVLQKRFYIIAPASPAEMGLITPSSILPGQGAFSVESIDKSILLEKATNILEPRVDHLTSQFNRLGLFARQLTTQEIIQNFYINYNPEAVEGQEISSSENYTTPLVRASFGGKFMQLNNIMQNQAAAQGQVQSTQPSSPTMTEAPASPPPTQEVPVVTEATATPAQAPQQSQVFPPTALPPMPNNLSPEYSSPSDEAVPPSSATEQAASEPTPVAEMTPAATQESATDLNSSPAVNLDLNLDSSLLNGQAPVAPATNTFDQFMSAATPQPEDIPVIETAPIVEETAPITEDLQQAASAAAVPSISEPAQVQTPTAETPDFAEEITPLQIQDDSKNV